MLGIIPIIAGLLGLASTFLTWKLSARRIIQAELDGIDKQLKELYAKRDQALVDKDTALLTICTDSIIRLCARQAVLLQRLGQSNN